MMKRKKKIFKKEKMKIKKRLKKMSIEVDQMQKEKGFDFSNSIFLVEKHYNFFYMSDPNNLNKNLLIPHNKKSFIYHLTWMEI